MEEDDVVQAKYFPDTNTLLLQFNDHKVAETYNVNKNVLVELDKEGCVVSITLEHAKRQTNVNEFSYQIGSVLI